MRYGFIPLASLLITTPWVMVNFPVQAAEIQIVQTDIETRADELYQQADQLSQEGTAASLQQAIEKWQAALKLYQELGDHHTEAITLSNIGLVYSKLGQPQEALNYNQQALAIFQEIGNRDSQASTLNNLGSVYSSIGQPEEALNYYQQAFAILQEIGDRRGEATTLNNMGSVYFEIGQPEEALNYYQQVLPIRQEVGDQGGEATTLNNMGSIYFEIGQPEKALNYYQQALPIQQEVGDRRGEATTLNNIGSLYSNLGQPQEALNYYQQALPIQQEIGDRRGEAVILNNMGLLYSNLGQPQEALNYYQQALPIFQEVGNRRGEAIILNNMGLLSSKLGQPQQALNYYQQALPIRQEVGDRGGEATTLNNIGLVYSDIGQPQKALNYYQQALPILQEVGDRKTEATTLNNMGSVYFDIGQPEVAFSFYQQALSILQEIGDRNSEVSIRGNLAIDKQSLGDIPGAITDIEAAINIIESIRSNLSSQEFRTTYFASIQHYYQLYIDLLMQLHQQNPTQGYDGQALHISERGRARSLLEILAEANAEIRQGVNPEMQRQEADLKAKINATASRQIEILSSSPAPEKAEAIVTELKNLVKELDLVQGKIRQTSPRYAALTQPAPLTLPQIQQQVLDQDTLLLEYSLGKERSYLWAVTPDQITSYELPPEAEIQEAVNKLREAITHPRFQHRTAYLQETSAAVSQMLLAPVADQFKNKRLLIVADGILQYIPFSVLSDPRITETYQPLLVNHEIINLPSASTLAILREQTQGRSLAPQTLAILADPVFSAQDERLQTAENTVVNLSNSALSRATGTLGISMPPTRLPFTRTEAQAILALVPGNQQELTAMDFSASRATVMENSLSQYQIVHFATHGFLNSVDPALSGIVLSLVDQNGNPQDGFLRLHDIYNLNLPAELIVLSACQTGLGSAIKGEGLVGLTRGFMYAGSKRVIVSLWSVSDEGTAELMTKFYQAYLQQGLTATAALRYAQLQLWSSDQWSSPYYWAPFIIQGEWR